MLGIMHYYYYNVRERKLFLSRGRREYRSLRLDTERQTDKEMDGRTTGSEHCAQHKHVKRSALVLSYRLYIVGVSISTHVL